MVKAGKIQKKRFFDVTTSATASKITLYAASAQELDGKIVRLDLTRNLRGKSLELRLRIKANGEELTAEPVALELAGSYVRRMMRKGSDYVEDSFEVSCKDAKVVVKPFMITRHKVSRAVRRILRNTAKEYILSHFITRTTKELATEITTNKFQKELSLKLKKVYPLALCEIRVFEILPEKVEFKAEPEKQQTEVIEAPKPEKKARKAKVESSEEKKD